MRPNVLFPNSSDRTLHNPMEAAGLRPRTQGLTPGFNIVLTLAWLALAMMCRLAADPTINKTTPVNQSASLGGSVTFEVNARGVAPVTYQWKFNGTEIEGARKSFLTLTNITLAHAGLYSAAVADATGTAESRQVSLYVDTTFTKITDSPIVAKHGNIYAVGWADVDGDGHVDLLLGDIGGSNGLYRNNGDGTFAAVVNDPVAKGRKPCAALSWGDYDNDGFPDLYFAAADGANDSLFHNNGNGSFTEVIAKVPGGITKEGADNIACSFGDYDGDGYLDLFVPSRGKRNLLFHNERNATFNQVTNLAPALQNGGWSSLWTDIDDDGDLDLLVGENSTLNSLYRNEGNGTFTRITDGAPVKQAPNADGLTAVDFDNNGTLDLFVANFLGTGNTLLRNDGHGHYEKVAGSAVAAMNAYTGAATWGDYDNDGFIDLFLGCGTLAAYDNALFHNNGDGTFTRITEGSLVHEGGQSFGVAWADYDNDGFLDLVVGNGSAGNYGNFLYHNNGNTNHWLKVKLEGTSSNRQGLGAKVYVEAVIAGAPRRQMREHSAGDGFSGNVDSVHFGLGDASEATALIIRWPSGIEQRIETIAANQTLTVREPVRLQASHAPGSFQFHAWVNQVFKVESSPDLLQWKPLATVTNLSTTVEFSDPDTKGVEQRFYRVAR